jgi:hypothetical protein
VSRDNEIVRGEVLPAAPDWPEAPESLEAAEEVIGPGLATFLEVGQALSLIRSERWYEELRFESFDDYCRERWGLTRRYADYQIEAAEVGTIVLARGLPAPANESVARPLAPLLKDKGEDELAATWGEIVRSHEGDGRITAAEVKRHLDGTPDKASSSGKPRLADLLGDAGDAFKPFSRKLAKAENEAKARGRTGNEFRAKAARYLVWCEAAAISLRKLAGVKDVEPVPEPPPDTPPEVLSLFGEEAEDAA